jgi:DNA-binding NtrC family response regulator
MKSSTILVLGHHARQDLEQMLRSVGMEPEVRGSVRGSLDRLRRGQLAAVLVDRRFARADVLEFVLNVRDVNETVPVIVIGAANDEDADQQIRQQEYTAVVEESRDMDVLSHELLAVLDRFKDQGQDGKIITLPPVRHVRRRGIRSVESLGPHDSERRQ